MVALLMLKLIREWVPDPEDVLEFQIRNGFALDFPTKRSKGLNVG